MTTPTPFLLPTDIPGIFELEFDNTKKELFETCNRAAEYYIIRKRELDREGAALLAGGVLHQALAQRMQNLPGWGEKQHQTIIDAYVSTTISPEEWRTPELLIDAIISYNKTYPIDKEPFTVVDNAVELPYRLLLGEVTIGSTIPGFGHIQTIKCFFTGRIDAVVNWDVPMVLDHKTTSMEGQSFYDDFKISSQMLGYTWACRQLGYPVQGLVLDAIAWRKPTKTGKGTTFQRQRYYYSDDQIAEWKKDTFAHITDFLEHFCKGYFPKSTKWCFGKYGQCQYFDVCTQPVEHREGLLMSALYRDVTWSPLK